VDRVLADLQERRFRLPADVDDPLLGDRYDRFLAVADAP
jgi:hypothetical protein